MTSALLQAFDWQAAWCRPAAPFTARVLQRSRCWLQHDQAAHDSFAAVAADPQAAALPLRWAGALHHLALLGLQPWASLWPPDAAGIDGAALDAALDAAVRGAWQQQHAHCAAALALPPQTNEVQRSAALLPGLLHVAAATGLPLRLLEIGASAGLNLWCERYRYAAQAEPAHADGSAWSWGDPQAALTLRPAWRGAAPPLQAPLRVQQRAGCDQHPVDLRQPGEGLRLVSFVWPDQPERLARLQAARELAEHWLQHEAVAVEALPAAQFVQRELRRSTPGQATVLMHSVVWQYIGASDQQAIRSALHDAGARATAQQPLAWLRFEPPIPDARMELRCQLWPGGHDLLLARGQAHGAQIHWLGA